MAIVAITGDLRGNIFSVDERGTLYHNRDPLDGSPWRTPGMGAPVGTGWEDVRTLFATRTAAAGLGHLLLGALTTTNALVATRLADPGNDKWLPDVSPPEELHDNWSSVRHVIAGPGGRIHRIGVDGVRRSWTFPVMPDGPFLLQKGLPEPLALQAPDTPSAGWDSLVTVMSSDGRVFFAINDRGQLLYRIESGGPGSGTWQVLDEGWFQYQGVFSATDTQFYAVTSEGSVELYRFRRTPDGRIELDESQKPDSLAKYVCFWTGLPAAVEGYCWPISAEPGTRVEFMVGQRQGPRIRPKSIPDVPTPDPTRYRVDFRRVRRLRGGREINCDDVLITDETTRQAPDYPLPTGIKWLEEGAAWRKSFECRVPADWPSGVYAARCSDTDGRGRPYDIPFVVLPRPGHHAEFAVLANANTWNAYSNWGGHGKYFAEDPGNTPRMRSAPFKRPHPGCLPEPAFETATEEQPVGLQVRNQSRHLLRGELWLMGWLEESGYRHDVITDFELDEGVDGIDHAEREPLYKALLLNVHPEYWTTRMYDHVQRYLELGGCLLYLAGNGIYEEIRYRRRRSVMELFPGIPEERRRGPRHDMVRGQCLLRNRGRPERALIGVGFEVWADGSKHVPYELRKDPSGHWLLKDLPLAVGDCMGDHGLIGPASGWEVDLARIDDGTPYNRVILAKGRSPVHGADMVCIDVPGKGFVFSVGSLNFTGSLVMDVNLQRIVKNALDMARDTSRKPRP